MTSMENQNQYPSQIFDFWNFITHFLKWSEEHFSKFQNIWTIENLSTRSAKSGRKRLVERKIPPDSHPKGRGTSRNQIFNLKQEKIKLLGTSCPFLLRPFMGKPSKEDYWEQGQILGGLLLMKIIPDKSKVCVRPMRGQEKPDVGTRTNQGLENSKMESARICLCRLKNIECIQWL